MRSESVRQLVTFPPEVRSANVAVVLDQGNAFLVAHEEGRLVLWHRESNEGHLIGDYGSEIETIAISEDNKVAIGCYSGLLVVLDLKNPSEQKVLQSATSSVFSRIWRAAWLDDSSLLTTSTYGSVLIWRRNQTGNWASEKIEGHHHSVFGLGVLNKRVVTGDYGGNVLVSDVDAGGLVRRASLSTSRIQNLAVARDGSFATISRYGALRFFGYDSTRGQWASPIDVASSTSVGNCVHITSDGQSVIAGTASELLQYDIQSEFIQSVASDPVIGVSSTPDHILAITTKGILEFQRSDAEAPLASVKYKFAKISLVGHTQVGKTSFAANLLGHSVQEIRSTLGRTVSTWIADPASVPERRVTLYDHGGQETVLGTFVPFLSDSDVIVVFFSQRELYSWEVAEEMIEDLGDAIARGSKILLVRTHIDEADEVRDAPIKRLMDRVPSIMGPFPVNNMSGEGVEELKRAIFNAIPWDHARTVIQSETNQAVEAVVQELKKENAKVISVREIQKRVQERAGISVHLEHLAYLLRNMTVEGVIEYYQRIDSVIFYDDSYNRLKSEVPFYVAEHEGVIEFHDLLSKLGPKEYVELLDMLYIEFGLSVRNDGIRIYPTVLSKKPLALKSPYLELLKSASKHGNIKAPLQRLKLGPLYSALSVLKLQCVGATATSGLLAWEKNACLYFSVNTTDDPLRGQFVTFDYAIGGSRSQMIERLEREFTAVVKQLYGELKPIESN
jgi:GTPase SAR1 family protein